MDRIDEVLIREHREIARLLDLFAARTMPDRPPEGGQELVQRVAIHHAIEEVVMRPVIEEILEEPGLVGQRHRDILLILERLANTEGLQSKALSDRFLQVRGAFVDHAECTELRLLVYLHRVLRDEDRRELGERHPEVVAELQAAASDHADVTMLFNELLGRARRLLPATGPLLNDPHPG